MSNDENRVPPQPSSFVKLANYLAYLLERPCEYVRETYVLPNQSNREKWYHEKFRRVATIEQCDEDDVICQFEANMQFKRDKLVDSSILAILRQRFEDCILYEAPDIWEGCTHLWCEYEEASTNWFIKYGDLGYFGTARDAYMKQKHRLIWERRNGPVGCGKRAEPSAEIFDNTIEDHS